MEKKLNIYIIKYIFYLKYYFLYYIKMLENNLINDNNTLEIDKKEQQKQRMKEYYLKNKERIKEQHKKYFQEHQEQYKQYKKILCRQS